MRRRGLSSGMIVRWVTRGGCEVLTEEEREDVVVKMVKVVVVVVVDRAN